ncbi:hypothetical protein SOV_04980 [Sporomusa ovata DSM 2662]|uniref:Uncharacterized protein n=1 Tax=Sporomusa ovata TaxID=2378 RepID=A0A0U1KW87_9FIRM|nr:hypothetical protein [Sporomusa ovata]EQB28168.1 hypothetical protein SOV_2c10910 [Sporomusa ovata DSM 2662]CQR71698.1 hypothetical protein SpAn4DRAFT_3564 [Sporomusa ovata]
MDYNQKSHSIKLILILIFLFISNVILPVNANEIVFKKEQSYELSDLISRLMISYNTDYVYFLQTIGEQGFNIYWDRDSENPNKEYFKYHRGGVAGILLNNQGRTRYKQEWADGLLKNIQAEVGLIADIHICGVLYWRPTVIKIGTAAPATLANLVNEKYPATEVLLKDYFAKRGFSVELISKQGSFSWGSNLYKISLPNKAPAWLFIRTSQGNRLGNTLIYLYYSYEDYQKDLPVINNQW